MTPAQKEIWVAVDANGIPAGSTDGGEAEARVTATALDESVPQWGPHRVQKYVTQERLDHSHEWYASRWERLDQLVREEATDEFKARWFNVMANGKAEVTEPPTFQSLLNKARYDAERERQRAKQAEGERDVHRNHADAFRQLLETTEKERDALLSAMLSGLDRRNPEAVGTFVSALIGALQTEDGATVVRYCGHLEKLLKESREKNEALTKERDNLLWQLEQHGWRDDRG